MTDGGESVCCVIEGCGCCSPLVRGVALEEEFRTGFVWLESDFKEDEEDETEEGAEDAE